MTKVTLNIAWLLVRGRSGLSLSEPADPLGFSHTRVYREVSEKEKIFSEQQLCRRKHLADVRGERRMEGLVRDDKKATLVTTKECRRAFQNLNEDGLQQQDATLGAAPVSPEQGSQAVIQSLNKTGQ